MAPATSHFVTPDNAAHYRDFLTALRADLQELIAMTRRYPVEVEFGEIRFVFVSEAEVLYCIESLESQLSALNGGARRASSTSPSAHAGV